MAENLPVAAVDYVDLGRQAIVGILLDQHAVVWPEIESRAADRVWGGLSSPVNPHVLTEAKRELLRDEVIDSSTARTRGGRRVTVFHLTDMSGRRREVERASARKRLLYARHRGWGERHPRASRGFLGPAGERVARASITATAGEHGFGFTPLGGGGEGGVNRVFDVPVRPGALDDAQMLHIVNQETRSVGPGILIPIEVKNVREWIYPRSPMLHQLLSKAAALSAELPDVPLLPMLICRRRQYRAWKMAVDLGVYVIEVYNQFVAPHASINREHFEEVKAELYSDVLLTESAHERLVNALTDLPNWAEQNVAVWQEVGSKLGDHYDTLRDRRLGRHARDVAMNELRAAAQTLGASTYW
jgi:hypothetical protein